MEYFDEKEEKHNRCTHCRSGSLWTGDTILSIHSYVFDVEHMNTSSKWRHLQCSLMGLSYAHS